ncbi:hypothetical protein B0T22DRAFT_536331, partial [Podospora appendiculata]
MSSDERSTKKRKLSPDYTKIQEDYRSSPSPAITIKTFHHFPHLSLELQLMIWEAFMSDYEDNPGVVWQLVWAVDESAPTDLSRRVPNRHLNVRPYIYIANLAAKNRLLEVRCNPLLKVCRESRRLAFRGHRYASVPVLHANVNIIVRPREDVFSVISTSIVKLIAAWEQKHGRLMEINLTEDMGFVKRVLMSHEDVGTVMLENALPWDHNDNGNGILSWYIVHDHLRTVERIFVHQQDYYVSNQHCFPASGRRFWPTPGYEASYRRENPDEFTEMVKHIEASLVHRADPRINLGGLPRKAMTIDHKKALEVLQDSLTLKWDLADGVMTVYPIEVRMVTERDYYLLAAAQDDYWVSWELWCRFQDRVVQPRREFTYSSVAGNNTPKRIPGLLLRSPQDRYNRLLRIRATCHREMRRTTLWYLPPTFTLPTGTSTMNKPRHFVESKRPSKTNHDGFRSPLIHNYRYSFHLGHRDHSSYRRKLRPFTFWPLSPTTRSSTNTGDKPATDGNGANRTSTVEDPCKPTRAWNYHGDATRNPFKQIFRDTAGVCRKRRDRARQISDDPDTMSDTDRFRDHRIWQNPEDSDESEGSEFESDVSDSDLDGQTEDLSDTDWRTEEDNIPAGDMEGGSQSSIPAANANDKQKSIFGNVQDTDKRHSSGVPEPKHETDQTTNHSHDSRTG